jgi:FMN reductase
MSKPLSVVTVSGSLHAPSKTGALLAAITAELANRLWVEVTAVEVHTLDVKLGAFPTGQPEPVREALALIESADLLVVAGPVYRGSYTGAFKQLFDLVGQNALVGTPVLLAATGGDASHSLVIDHQLRPLFGFFSALSLPVGVYAKDQDYTDGAVTAESLVATIERAVETALPYLRADRRLVSPVEALRRIAGGARAIDVRSNEGRDATGTVDGAEVVLKTDVAAWAADVDPENELVVFCGSVLGSGPVVQQLADAGFTNVVHVDGGFGGLRRSGAPTQPARA